MQLQLCPKTLVVDQSCQLYTANDFGLYHSLEVNSKLVHLINLCDTYARDMSTPAVQNDEQEGSPRPFSYPAVFVWFRQKKITASITYVGPGSFVGYTVTSKLH